MDRDLTHEDLPFSENDIKPGIQSNLQENNLESKKWGIEFMDTNHAKWLGSMKTGYHFGSFNIASYQFIWEVKVPDDAVVSIGCRNGPNHNPNDFLCCFGFDNHLAADKIEVLKRVRNPYYRPVDHYARYDI